MAFDALRLRSVIQLIGILGNYHNLTDQRQRSHPLRTAFHLALVVFASIQIHETRSALINPHPTSTNVWTSFTSAFFH